MLDYECLELRVPIPMILCQGKPIGVCLCRAERNARQTALDEASARMHSLTAAQEQLQGQHAELQAHCAALQGGLQSCREALQTSQNACASAEVSFKMHLSSHPFHQ